MIIGLLVAVILPYLRSGTRDDTSKKVAILVVVFQNAVLALLEIGDAGRSKMT